MTAVLLRTCWRMSNRIKMSRRFLLLMLLIPILFIVLKYLISWIELLWREDELRDIFQADIPSIPGVIPQYIHSSLPHDRLLNPFYITNNVYYIWCGRGPFLFSHYLSVLSVIRYLRPDSINFLYRHPPVIDKETYNTWLLELYHSYPYFRKEQMTSRVHDLACSAEDKIVRARFIYDLLNKTGGFYVSERTLLTDFPVEYRLFDVTSSFDPQSGTGLLMVRSGHLRHATVASLTSKNNINNKNSSDNNKNSGNYNNNKIFKFSCLTQDQFNQNYKEDKAKRKKNLTTAAHENIIEWVALSNASDKSSRMIARDLILSNTLDRFNKSTTRRQIISNDSDGSSEASCAFIGSALFPRDIWEADTGVARLARSLFYGREEVVLAKPSYKELVPNIAHIVWIGGGKMDFLFYLCLLSLLHVVKVEKVYIHGDKPPHGEYWQLVKDNDRVELIDIAPPSQIFGSQVNVVSHMSDIWRVDLMIKYGGIYVDTDVIFVKELDRDIRGYDAVATYDFPDNTPFPDIINFGVTLGKRNAPFWKEFQKSMRWFKDNEWTWNGLRQPYRILERNPELLQIDPRLQVTCYKLMCHPTWWTDYHNVGVHHLNRAISDWRKDAYSYHWTHPTPPELSNHTSLMTGNSTMFAEIGRFILREAEMLEYFAKRVKEH